MDFANINSIVTWYINWRRLLAIIIFQRSSLKLFPIFFHASQLSMCLDASFVDHLCFFCLVFVMPLCASVYLCLVVTCWLSFVVSNCEFVTFPLVTWVRYGT